MKIPVKAKKYLPGIEKLFPFVEVVIKHKMAVVRADALVDTGSPITAIAPKDWTRMRIPPLGTLSSSPQYIRLAGWILPTYPLKDVRLAFWDEEKNPVKVEMSSIGVFSYPARAEGIEYLPTILGTDFLEDQNFALYFNPSGRVGYLEKVV